jgi:trehalose 6-phosphate synthase
MRDMEQYLAGRTLILVSNREPYEHTAPDTVRRPPGGLVSALDPTMRRTHGTWVAWGSGPADRETADADGRVQVPPEQPEYTLRRVWLDDADVDGYYLGFANSGLWPICHMLLQHYEMRSEHWERYVDVNARFAAAAADEVRRAPTDAVVWVQDYHLAVATAQLREALDAEGRSAFLHQFWHIPFPPPDILRLLPTAAHEGVLRGMLGNDLLEFHTERYASNFLDCVAEFVPEAHVRREDRSIHYAGRDVHVGAFPISIDAELYESLARAPEGARRAAELRQRYACGDRVLGVSVDRIDYTKGIPERLRALDQLWTDAPDLRGRLTFLLVATPSRSELSSYQALEHDVIAGVEIINAKFARDDWTPIVLLRESIDAAGLAGLYRAGDLCLVSSLQDGMNLVAKEFIACNVDEQGVLVLSRLTGAADEIEDAILINPFNVDGVVDGLRRAIAMPLPERRARMQRMRAHLARATIFDWLEAILARVADLADAGTRAAGSRPRRAIAEQAARPSSPPDVSVA